MVRKPNIKMIGLFMIISFFLLLSTLGFLLRDKFFVDQDTIVVMFFEESVKGLSVGSPVVFKGVEIGKVTKIDLVTNPETFDFSIPVYAQIYNREIKEGQLRNRKEMLDLLVSKGLRARLTTQSYLTGQLMIELEMMPDVPAVSKTSSYPFLEIPTTLSPIGEFSKGIQDIPVKQTFEKVNVFFDTWNKELPVLLPQVEKLVANMDLFVNKNSKISTETLRRLNQTLTDISRAAKSLQNFTDYIEQHPESLLKGKKR